MERKLKRKHQTKISQEAYYYSTDIENDKIHHKKDHLKNVNNTMMILAVTVAITWMEMKIAVNMKIKHTHKKKRLLLMMLL